MISRILKLAELLYLKDRNEYYKSLHIFNGYIQKNAYCSHNNEDIPNPWRRNMDYAEWENSPYFGSISEFMKKFPRGIEDWRKWREKTKKEKYKMLNLKKRKAYLMGLMKKAEIDYDDLSSDYKPTKQELEYANQPPTDEEKEKAFNLLLKNIEAIKEMADLSDEDVKDWLKKHYGQEGMAAEDDNKLLEELAELEHNQWMEWAKSIMKNEDLSKERTDRWEKESFKPYDDLSEEQKDMDREWAEKVLKIVNKYNQKADDFTGYFEDIEKDTEGNENYRKVVFTGKHLQLVLMTLNPNEEIGDEVHKDTDQFFRIEEGEATFVLNGEEKTTKSGGGVVVPAGTKHNVINKSNNPLKVYTIYAPPKHPEGVIEKTKTEEAERESNDKVAHYIPFGGDDVNKYGKEPHLYSGEMDQFKTIDEYLKKYHSGQDAKDAAFDAAKDFIRYWRKLLKKKSELKDGRKRIACRIAILENEII